MMSNHNGYKGNRSTTEYDPSWESLRPRVIAEIPNVNHFATTDRRKERFMAWLDEKLGSNRLLTTSLVAIVFLLIGLCGGLLISVKPTVKTPMTEAGLNFVTTNHTRPEEASGSFNNGNWSNQASMTMGNQHSQQISPAEKQQAIDVLSQPVVRSDSIGVTPFPTLGSPITSGSSPDSYPSFPNEQSVSRPMNPPSPSGSSSYLQQESVGWHDLSPASPSLTPAMVASAQTSYPNTEFHPQATFPQNTNSTPFPQATNFQQQYPPSTQPQAGQYPQSSYSPPVMVGETGQPYTAPLAPPTVGHNSTAQIAPSTYTTNMPAQVASTTSALVPVSSSRGFVGYSNVGGPATTAPMNTNTSPTSTINSTMSQPMYESPTRGW